MRQRRHSYTQSAIGRANTKIRAMAPTNSYPSSPNSNLTVTHLGDIELTPGVQVDNYLSHTSINVRRYIDDIGPYQFYRLLKNLLKFAYTNTQVGQRATISGRYTCLTIDDIFVDKDGDICRQMITLDSCDLALITTCTTLITLVHSYLQIHNKTISDNIRELFNKLVSELHSLSINISTLAAGHHSFDSVELHILYSIKHTEFIS